MKKLSIRSFIPNLFTFISLTLGLTAVKFAMENRWEMSVSFIVFASFLDNIDGKLARFLKSNSHFGVELDSLSDFLSFGIAPAFIIYFWELNKYGKLGWAITLIYSVCCVLRLARFNLTKLKPEENWKQNYFEGVPSPIGALLIL